MFAQLVSRLSDYCDLSTADVHRQLRLFESADKLIAELSKPRFQLDSTHSVPSSELLLADLDKELLRQHFKLQLVRPLTRYCPQA